jgi:hypothetical protein
MSEQCVPGCRYRSLYEGSQASLADMAAKQSHSILEHNKLRKEILIMLKRYFPKEFRMTEQALGKRLETVEDSVLSAYLDKLLSAQSAHTGLTGLKAALVAAGFAIATDDIDEWIKLIQSSSTPLSLGRTTQHPTNPTDIAVLALDNLLNPNSDEIDLAEVESVEAGSINVDATLPSSAQAVENKISTSPPSLPTTSDAIDKLFADILGENHTNVAGKPNIKETETSTGVPATNNLFNSTDGVLGSNKLDSSTDVEGTPNQDTDIDVTQLTDVFSTPTQPVSPPQVDMSEAVEGLFKTAVLNASPGVSEDAPAPQLGDARPPPLKPELLSPKTPVRKVIRTVAVKADVPEAHSATTLSSKAQSALLASVAIPRPVFVMDLAQTVGSRTTVEDWETKMRELKTDSPVRFIGGKARHRLRGALVIPHGDLRDASSEFTSSWWAECLSRYRGAKLYELAVLLHRVGADVIASEFDDDVVLLRLNDKRGLIGMLVVINDDFTNPGITADKLLRRMRLLIKERLGIVALITINTDTETPVIQLLSKTAQQEKWVLNAPVVLSTSWDWADDHGETAKSILSS